MIISKRRRAVYLGRKKSNMPVTGMAPKKLKSDLHAFAGDLKHAEKGKRVSKKVNDDTDIKAREIGPGFGTRSARFI